jgi:hypothetical protein
VEKTALAYSNTDCKKGIYVAEISEYSGGIMRIVIDRNN